MKLFMMILMTTISVSALAEWNIDLSRRGEDLKRTDMEELAAPSNAWTNPLTAVFEKEQPTQEIVIANTDKGFVPKTLNLKKGQSYQISVVNVNKSKKNVSFMLDAFAEHHGTYFGEVVSFTVKPQREGLFQFYCPEAEFVGKVLVNGSDKTLEPVPAIRIRQPASVTPEDDASDVVLRGGNE